MATEQVAQIQSQASQEILKEKAPMSQDRQLFAHKMTKQMHTHELLDRFELLYADEEPILADLRRAIIDDDLSSIFRVADAIAIKKENIDDLRKVVMEKNLHYPKCL